MILLLQIVPTLLLFAITYQIKYFFYGDMMQTIFIVPPSTRCYTAVIYKHHDGLNRLYDRTCSMLNNASLLQLVSAGNGDEREKKKAHVL